MTTDGLLPGAEWRKSSFSGGGGNGGGGCVEAAHLPGGRIALRDSKSPRTGAVFFTRDELAAWLKHLRSGQLD